MRHLPSHEDIVVEPARIQRTLSLVENQGWKDPQLFYHSNCLGVLRSTKTPQQSHHEGWLQLQVAYTIRLANSTHPMVQSNVRIFDKLSDDLLLPSLKRTRP